MSMRVAIQENLLPGTSRREKFANARTYGYQGIEARGNLLLGNEREYQELSEAFGLPITTICGGIQGCLLDPDPRERELAVGSIVNLMRAGHTLGGAHVIVAPIFGRPRLPDLTPFQSAEELELSLLVPLLQQIATGAEAEGLTARLLLEPLNRYETHLFNRVEQAVAVVEQVGSPVIAVMADVFHMQLEEIDTWATLRQFNSRIQHIHLADSNRKLPGQGQLDFAGLFGVLHELDYSGTLALECGILGRAEEQLPGAAALLNDLVTNVPSRG